MKKIIGIIVLIGAIFAIWLFKIVFISQNGTALSRPVNIDRGQSLTQITETLYSAGVVQNKAIFASYVRFKRASAAIKAGEHNLPGNLSIRQLVNSLVSGATINNEISITIPEGWNLRDIAKLLIDNKLIGKAEDLFAWTGVPAEASSDVSRLSFNGLSLSYSLPAGHSLEGYLFPDTYRVYMNSTVVEIVTKMLGNFDSKWKSLSSIKNQSGLNMYEVVTLASIVSEEGKTIEDKKMIAGVFLNRLSSNIALQSDPTVNYVTKKVTDNPSLDDISLDSPYNTYKNRGLPPGPISNPGLDDLIAVLQPTKHNYYYFLNTKDGKLIYSKTFEEHKANRIKYGQ